MDQPELLERHKRDLQWNDVETFYEDKNNFAMYLVLPIIVIVYGGCAVIYCIARCRRYAKRKKRKPKTNDFQENEPLDNASGGTTIPVISNNQNGISRITDGRDGAMTSSDVQVSMERDRETPLPWQVPGDRQPLVGATAAAIHHKKQEAYNNAYEPDLSQVKRGAPPPPPPSYEETYHKRPLSKPPPYEEKGNRERRGSVEEIITLDPIPVAIANQEYNDRKRRRPGSRASSRQSNEIMPQEKETNNYDLEREKARQLVRGDRPKREFQPQEKYNRERTPDIISHARTKPLEPRYKPTHPDPRTDPRSDPNLMAKQAAQLLRLDHMGKQQGKKQKRLVFVAE